MDVRPMQPQWLVGTCSFMEECQQGVNTSRTWMSSTLYNLNGHQRTLKQRVSSIKEYPFIVAHPFTANTPEVQNSTKLFKITRITIRNSKAFSSSVESIVRVKCMTLSSNSKHLRNLCASPSFPNTLELIQVCIFNHIFKVGRYKHTVSYNELLNIFVICGGIDENGQTINDINVLDLKALNW